MAISPQRLTIYLYSAHRAVIYAIAQLSCMIISFYCFKLPTNAAVPLPEIKWKQIKGLLYPWTTPPIILAPLLVLHSIVSCLPCSMSPRASVCNWQSKTSTLSRVGEGEGPEIDLKELCLPAFHVSLKSHWNRTRYPAYVTQHTSEWSYVGDVIGLHRYANVRIKRNLLGWSNWWRYYFVAFNILLLLEMEIKMTSHHAIHLLCTVRKGTFTLTIKVCYLAAVHTSLARWYLLCIMLSLYVQPSRNCRRRRRNLFDSNKK